jgi:hypothetical protein
VIPTLVIVLVGLCLALAGVLFARTDAGESFLDDLDSFISGNDNGNANAAAADDSGSGEITAIPIVSAQAFDPEGDSGLNGENPNQAQNVADGDASTGWRTEKYNARSLPPLKAGVGVYVVLEGRAQLARLDVTSSSNDWNASVYVADSPADTLSGWGQPVATAEGIGERASFDLGGREGGAVLLWITDLGDGPPRVFTQIDEMTVVGS